MFHEYNLPKNEIWIAPKPDYKNYDVLAKLTIIGGFHILCHQSSLFSKIDDKKGGGVQKSLKIEWPKIWKAPYLKNVDFKLWNWTLFHFYFTPLWMVCLKPQCIQLYIQYTLLYWANLLKTFLSVTFRSFCILRNYLIFGSLYN